MEEEQSPAPLLLCLFVAKLQNIKDLTIFNIWGGKTKKNDYLYDKNKMSINY